MISCLLRLVGFTFCVYGWEITWIFVAEKIEGNGGFSGQSCLMTVNVVDFSKSQKVDILRNQKSILW